MGRDEDEIDPAWDQDSLYEKVKILFGQKSEIFKLKIIRVKSSFPDCRNFRLENNVKKSILANTFFRNLWPYFRPHDHMDQVKLTQKPVWARFYKIQFISTKN